MTRHPIDRPAGMPPVFPAGPATSPASSEGDVAAPGPPDPRPRGARGPGAQTSAPTVNPNPPPVGAGQAPAGGVVGRPRPPAGFHSLAAVMSEDRGPDSLDAHVRRLIKDLGLRGYHTKDSRRSAEGYPDWTIVGNRVLFRELKREGKGATRAQREWLEALTVAGEDADVWRPLDLFSGRIGRELAAISRLGRAA